MDAEQEVGKTIRKEPVGRRGECCISINDLDMCYSNLARCTMLRLSGSDGRGEKVNGDSHHVF